MSEGEPILAKEKTEEVEVEVEEKEEVEVELEKQTSEEKEVGVEKEELEEQKEAMTKSAMSDDTDWDKVDDDIPHSDEKTDTDTVAVTEDVNDSNVVVKEAVDVAAPAAHQIVSIGTDEDQYKFTFHEDTLQGILKQIPEDTKVCVVSVVGAFRTGKSFLLSWFLRYLSHYESLHQNDQEEVSTGPEGEKEKKWYEKESKLGRDGFHWRGGSERNTTGIWMWSKPYILPRVNDNGEKEDIAVVLVDTQGMFDHETPMELTASIFGLSTLLSSYQIYNVDKNIQEDNLQQLALFSEYGRMAIQNDTKEKKKTGEDKVEKKDDEESDEILNNNNQKPFQQIEFLVRDWQHFEDEDDLDACEREMEEYLEGVLKLRDASDLKDTREQITACFENVRCYLMTHPGKAVTQKKYEGEMDPIDPVFKELMDRFCTRVFQNLVPKSIHARELTAMELGAYMQNYAKMFEKGAAQFPEAATMLEATSNANNTNALNLTMKKYKEEMDSVAGVQQTDYMNSELLEEFHRTILSKSMRSFDDIACFGNTRAIGEARREVLESINENFVVYAQLNESKNPLAGFATYIVPLVIGFLSIVLRWTADWTCSSWSQTCKAGSEFLSHVYQVVFFFLVIVASTKAKQLSDAGGRLKKAWEVMNSGGASATKKDN